MGNDRTVIGSGLICLVLFVGLMIGLTQKQTRKHKTSDGYQSSINVQTR